MIKTLITFVIAGIGFIVTVDYAHAERIVCYRDYNGNAVCEVR
jgi:hypothetical protein